MRLSLLQDCKSDDIAYVIDQYIHNQRNRELLKERYINGKTFGELSYQFGIEVDTVKQIVKKGDYALLKLF